MKSVGLNMQIVILQAEKGNYTVVLDESEYKDKLNILIESGVHEPLPKYSEAKVERKFRNS
jgi:hypothetical protein